MRSRWTVLLLMFLGLVYFMVGELRWHNAHDVTFEELGRIQDEDANQAGSAYPASLLLDSMQKIARSDAERAEVLRRRCGLIWAMQGAERALPVCQDAVRLGDGAGGVQSHKNRQRLSLVLSALKKGDEAHRLAFSLEVPKEPLAAGLLYWARGQALLAQGNIKSAVDTMSLARGSIELAAQLNPKHEEFLAIADLHLGEALIAAKNYDEAKIVLRRGMIRQRALDLANPEYAEYRLYLVRLGTALGRVPGQEQAAEVATGLRDELIQRDPTRAEYKE